MKIGFPILAVACVLAGCSADSADWQFVESEGGNLALSFDAKSVKRQGSVVTFWTRLASTSAIRRATHGETRTKMQVDCQRQQFRHLAGGVYLRGKLKYPFTKLASGPIPSGGYMEKLAGRVC